MLNEKILQLNFKITSIIAFVSCKIPKQTGHLNSVFKTFNWITTSSSIGRIGFLNISYCVKPINKQTNSYAKILDYKVKNQRN